MLNEKFLLKSPESGLDEYLRTLRLGKVQLNLYRVHLYCPVGKAGVSYSHKGLGNHQIICMPGSMFAHDT